jgi:uncharacterized protein (DUF1330 family)
MTAPAYLVVTMHITDPDRYKEYMAKAPACVKAFGGEYIVRGGKQETLEGGWQPKRMALLKFPSYEKAKAFYEDGPYKEVRKLREGATEYFNMVLVEGVESQPA